MTRFPGLRRLFRLDRPADVERAVDDELRFHFEMKVRDLVAGGLSEPDARREAERRFGDVQNTRDGLAAIDRDRVGAARRAEWWDGVGQDLRYALRGLRLKPAFAAGIIVTLGLGIGANATMFGIVDRLMLRAPAYLSDAGSVHRVYYGRTFDGQERITANTSYRRYLDFRASSTAFGTLAGTFTTQLPIGTGADSREQDVQLVSASFWSLFDARPAAGRFFGADEDSLGVMSYVAVLSWGQWRRAYGGRPDAVGERIRIGRHDYTIIGVAPRGFQGMSLKQPLVFLPLTTGGVEMWGEENGAQMGTSYGFSWMEIFGRRKDGVSAEAATSDLTRSFLSSYASQREQQSGAPPAEVIRPRAIAGSVLRERGPRQGPDSKVATWLIGVAAVVLIIACANVGNLLLARAFGRRREIAVRLALGVSRGRLIRQLLAESVLLAALGGAAGLAIAQWGGGVLRATLLPNVEWPSMLADPRLLGFAALVALGAGLITGLAPAIQATRADLTSALKTGVREGTFHRSRLRTGLLVLQGALSVVLLVGAGLFVRSLHRVRTMPLGYDPDRVLFVSPDMRSERLDSARARLLREALLERARELPMAEHAARSRTVPFWMTMDFGITVPGIDSASRLGSFEMQVVSPGYFPTMGTRILRGRPIEESDRDGSELVVVTSASMARVLWPGKEALGQCVKVGDSDTIPCRTVVGIAEDVKTSSLRDDPGLLYYMPAEQFGPHQGGLFVRTRGEARHQAEAVRLELQRLMPGDAYVTVTPLADVLQPEMRSFTLGATMFTVFGVLALVVAAVGLYSVVAYGVAQRSHELGVRLALGAQQRDVIRLVVGEGLRTAAVAVTLGLLAALVAARWIAPLLFNTSPRDPGAGRRGRGAADDRGGREPGACATRVEGGSESGTAGRLVEICLDRDSLGTRMPSGLFRALTTYCALSAAVRMADRVRPSRGNSAAPTLTLSGGSRPSPDSASETRRPTCSAAATPASGRTTRNSSPP